MPFRYLRDPLFLVCLATYFVNRLVLKPLLPIPFLHNHLNDLICIPFWVPIMLYLQKSLRLRPMDDPPTPGEIIIPLIIWSWAFELWLPGTAAFSRWCTSDPMDVLFYSAGALGTSLFWRAWYAPRPRFAPEMEPQMNTDEHG